MKLTYPLTFGVVRFHDNFTIYFLLLEHVAQHARCKTRKLCAGRKLDAISPCDRFYL